MGQEEILWDDSIFIRAFDDAVSKYKIMHVQKILDSSAEGGEVFNGSDTNHERIRSGDEKSYIEANNVVFEVDKTMNTSPAKENICLEPCPISSVDFSDALHVKEMQQAPIEHSHINLQAEEGYNQLLNQYYELEEKRQKVLEQLYQCGCWNYQGVGGEGFGNGAQWGTSFTYQEHPVSASQTSQNHVISSCWPSSYPIAAAVATGPQSSSRTDSDIIKTAMGAAERAISSMKAKIPEKESEEHDGIMPQSASSETGLAAVLNAWYSAGFHTGK